MTEIPISARNHLRGETHQKFFYSIPPCPLRENPEKLAAATENIVV